MREADAIKLFVGQVPRDWTEKELREILEPYGEIHNLNLLKDKATGQHKGCGFLTYYSNESAKSAQEELHGKRTLPGARNPLQIKPAQSETNDENRKLFIGMLSRSLHDSELRDMFSSFGTIEDLKILRNPEGKSKGCAFIKFETRLQAQNAIKAMHNSQTMEGNTKPIVVKLADTEKDKLSRRMQQGSASHMPVMGLQDPGYISGLPPLQTVPLQPTANYHQLLAQVGVPQIVAANPSVPGAMGAVFAINPQQQLQQQQLVQHYQPQYLAQQPLTQQLTQQSLTQQQLTQQQQLAQQLPQHLQLQQPLTQQQLTQQPLAQQQLTQAQLTQQQLPPQVAQTSLYTDQTSQLPYSTYIVAPPTSNIGNNIANIQNPYGGYTTGATNLSVLSVGSNGYATTAGVAGASAGSTILADNTIQQPYSGVKQYITTVPQSYGAIQQQSAATSKHEGPDGANLFIYQIPVEFNDNDLLQTFVPFGNVLSAKVFVDKATGLSKCFGFVSYDSASSASLAISQMNGVVMGAKRLRVQHKRPKEHGKPY